MLTVSAKPIIISSIPANMAAPTAKNGQTIIPRAPIAPINTPIAVNVNIASDKSPIRLSHLIGLNNSYDLLNTHAIPNINNPIAPTTNNPIPISAANLLA